VGENRGPRAPLSWRNLPRKPEETLLVWTRRWLKLVLVERAGSPFELFSEIRHPVVRAEGRRTARKRLQGIGVCVGLPVVFFLFVSLASPFSRSLLGLDIGYLAGSFCALWPLVMYAGAALATAGAVMEEIEQNTAIQLVLTPIPARPLAAAKILPRVWPYLWGILATLPLYVWAGGTGMLALGRGSDLRMPSPLVIWPLRMIVTGLPGEDWSFQNPLLAVFNGSLMCLFDFTLVWSAALWGTVFAVGERGLLRTSLRLVLHMVVTGVVIGLCLLGGVVVAMLPISCASVMSSSGEPLPLIIGGAVGVLLGLALFGFLWWKVVLCRPADETLTVFQAFDRLANEEFNVGLPRWVEGAVERGAAHAGMQPRRSADGPPTARLVPGADRRGKSPPSK
jgi:hypothetical protein